MKAKLLLLFFCMISYTVAISQNTNIKGKVLTYNDKKPVCYSSIGIKGSSVGTISNEQGDFELQVPESNAGDSILISAIGFKSKKIAIETFKSQNKTHVYLESHSFTLKEVNVISKGLTAKDIVEQSIQSIYKNYPRRNFSMEVFFREATIVDTTYSLLTETVADITNNGYKKDTKRSRFKIKEFRKSNDYRNLNWSSSLREWLYEKNGLYECYKNDRLKIKKKNNFLENDEYYKTQVDGPHRFFNSDFLSQMQFNMDSISYFDNQAVYCISYKTSGKLRFFCTCKGQILIKKSDWAVLQFRSTLYVDEEELRNKKEADGTQEYSEKFIQMIKGHCYDGKHRSTVLVKYKQIGKKYYLSYIRIKKAGTSSLSMHGGTRNYKEASESNWSTGMLYQDNELFVSRIYSKPKKIRWTQRMNKTRELYKNESQYNKEFWSNYTTIVRNPITRKIQSDLNIQLELEKQFEQNGK